MTETPSIINLRTFLQENRLTIPDYLQVQKKKRVQKPTAK